MTIVLYQLDEIAYLTAKLLDTPDTKCHPLTLSAMTLSVRGMFQAVHTIASYGYLQDGLCEGRTTRRCGTYEKFCVQGGWVRGEGERSCL